MFVGKENTRVQVKEKEEKENINEFIIFMLSFNVISFQ